jgi:pyruvate dehydrogenase E2 component (dihydrolipoamide acetyltransferase)
MNRYEFKLPDIGEGVTEGEIVKWHVKPGDVVREDQPLVDVMTDKATVGITCPKAGTVTEVHGKEGQVVKVHAVLAVFDLGGAGAAAAKAQAASASKDEGPAATAVGDIKDSLPGMGTITTTTAPAASTAAVADDYRAPNGKALATPATRKLARDLGVDLTRVRPTGPSDRVTRDDVRAYAERAQAPAPAVAATAASMVTAPAAAQAATEGAVAPAAAHAPSAMMARAPVSIPHVAPRGATALEERVALAGVRRRIADRMALSKHTAAHFTFVEECDVTALKSLRERLKPRAEARGVKLTFLPFIAKAVVAALKKHPILNSALDESTNEIVYRKYYNLGIAAASEAGLIVPVLKDADSRSLLDCAREIERLGNDVRAGKVKVEDLQGSTFTITSLGAQGGLFATPIINFPEVAILGVHQIKQKPVVRDGQIVIGDVMLLSLSFDHRVVDGHVGAAFAYDIIGYLQDPDALLLEV